MRLLDGPPPAAGPERLASHNQRLGHLSAVRRRPELIPLLEASGLRGRGGAAFPVGRKWRTVAERRSRGAVVLANGAEGEPLSLKDRVLMAARPHLVLDGALLAADAVGADDMVLYVGHEHRGARAALEAALRERPEEARRVRVVEAPPGFVSGEETAAVHYLNAGRALPTSIPPRPFERGVGGRATLVQNVESLAVAGLLARGGTAGAGLITLSNGVAVPGVCEIDLGMTVGEAAALGGGLTGPQQAVLLGGHFGAWVGIEEAWALPLEVGALRAAGLGFGVGVLAFLPATACGVRATAGIVTSLARASAGQCGPCVHGLQAIAEATARLADGSAADGDLNRLARWCGQLPGRGACRHPDGAALLVQSALRVFAEDFAAHQSYRRCPRQQLQRGAA
jgi:NADH:ubiquinone oxidoreductase subunit F (NADH-binding)